MKPFDPDLGEVERKDLVRGYEIADGKYVTVTDEDLAEIRLKSTKTIEIERFVDFDEIDPLYIDGAYYVMPDGKMALEAYAVIREAMKKEHKAAEGRLVLSYREHVVILQPRENGLILFRMRDAREVESQAPFKNLGEGQGRSQDGRDRHRNHRAKGRQSSSRRHSRTPMRRRWSTCSSAARAAPSRSMRSMRRKSRPMSSI